MINQLMSDKDYILIHSNYRPDNHGGVEAVVSGLIGLLGLFGPTQAVAANPIGGQQLFIKSDVQCAPCYSPCDGIHGLMYTYKKYLHAGD